MKNVFAPLMILLLATAVRAQQNDQTLTRTRAPQGDAAPEPAVTVDDIRQLREQLQQQQAEIQQLRQELHQRDQAAPQPVAAVQQAGQTASESPQSTTSQESLQQLRSDVADLKASMTTVALNAQEEQKRVSEMVESPVALHYKGITITPGGFLAAETVWHQHAMASDVNTPFNAVPFSGNGQYHLSEFFGSGRPSRITLLAEGKLNKAKFTGYYEMDFLSAGVTSNNNQSNSYTNRQRQVWGQAALNNGWSFTGGQMWSLVTETKNGLDNRTEATPSVIDHAYHVGFSWSRQYGFRVVKNFNNKVWLGFSVENAQTLLTAHGNQNNFVFGNAGTGG